MSDSSVLLTFLGSPNRAGGGVELFAPWDMGAAVLTLLVFTLQAEPSYLYIGLLFSISEQIP